MEVAIRCLITVAATKCLRLRGAVFRAMRATRELYQIKISVIIQKKVRRMGMLTEVLSVRDVILSTLGVLLAVQCIVAEDLPDDLAELALAIC